MQRLAFSTDVPSHHCRRPWALGTICSLGDNRNDASGRRHCNLLGKCVLVVMICYSILRSGNRTTTQTGTDEFKTRPANTTMAQALVRNSDPKVHGLTVQDIYSQRTSQILMDGTSNVVPVTPKALEQIQNFRQGNGLILNIVRR